MSNILEMSPNLITYFPCNLFNLYNNTGASGSNINGNPSDTGLLQLGDGQNTPAFSIANIYIMKGAVPPDLSSLTSTTVRAADILATFTTGVLNGQATIPNGICGTGAATTDFTPSILYQNPIVINTVYKTATQAGTATWFWWVVGPAPISGQIGTTITHQIIGTVGTIGSGADLQISNVNIALGESVKLANFEIQFPTSWSF
jgi:hypothetical protein